MADRLFLVYDTVVARHAPPEGRVRFARSLSAARKTWRASTRISPLVAADPRSKMLALEKLSRAELFFIGPIAPRDIPESIRQHQHVWFGYGAFNVVCAPRSPTGARELEAWLRRNGQRYEKWILRRGAVKSVTYPPGYEHSLDDPVHTGHTPRNTGPSLDYLVDEYETIMASAFQRASHVEPRLADELSRLNRHVVAELKRPRHGNGQIEHESINLLLSLNAGLSRFSSQAFCGTSPIATTECHFWTHSLLGIGIANLGLWRLSRFILDGLEQQRIPQRITASKQRRRKSPVIDLLRLEDNDAYWRKDQLEHIRPERDRRDERLGACPVVTYFSGRDLYHATRRTLSAPLAAIDSATSTSWTLHTVTHEISHILVEGVLSELYPSTERNVEKALTELRAGSRRMFGQIRRKLLHSVLMMHAVDSTAEHSSRVVGTSRDPADVLQILLRLRPEVEELLVSVVDYMHSYGNGDAGLAAYFRDIWSSWSAMPNLADRVDDYVLRSLCVALMRNQDSLPNWDQRARQTLVRALEDLRRGGGIADEYLRKALSLLNHKSSWNMLRRRLLARRGLVSIARSFIVSDAVAKVLLGDDVTSRRDQARTGVARRGDFFVEPPRNPLRLIERATLGPHSSIRDSIWLFNQLAFSKW